MSSLALRLRIDGRVLADEYHSTYLERPVIIATSNVRSSVSGDIVLKDPTPSAAADAVQRATHADTDGQSDAACQSGSSIVHSTPNLFMKPEALYQTCC
jgi:hypothetical protein